MTQPAGRRDLSDTDLLDQYRFFIEQMAEGVWRAELEPPMPLQLSPDDQVRYCIERARLVECNDSMLRMYGCRQATDLVGTRLGDTFDLQDPRTLKFFRSFVDQGFRSSDLESYEFDQQGTPRWFLNNLVGMVENDHLTRIWGTQRDITGQKLAEDELRSSQEQLRQAQKMEAVGRLAGGIAHDFNNLLTAILSYSEMVLADLPAEDAIREDVEQIRQAANRAAELTNQLLAFSRRQMQQLRTVNLNTAVLGVDRMLRRLIGADVELRTVLAPDLGYTRADPGQLEQVLLNLAVNARDAMPTGGVLTLTTANADVGEMAAARWGQLQPGSYVTISVQDNGTGMAPEVQERIFEPFFTTKGPGEGTGLGLPTVYGIVKQSGGHVFVASAQGAGSIFTIYLPATDASPEPAGGGAPAPPVRGAAETVLLVEDEELVRQLAREILVRNGYRVLEAADGAEALRICEQHAEVIHLMITDVVMPRMSGRELVNRVRPRRPGMRVLYVSGYSEEAIQHHGRLTEGVDLLPKPFTPAVLTAKVREILDRTQ